ncbi:FAD-dependent oxidoreductase, partial [Salmonella enterica subsp. enterica serovar Senftenberg]|nr:FAD-dependent oxidoreductase [Salmonella enterica subsp. enterica serovar Senftenberg]
MNNHDVLVVGGGAAGLSAALVLGRARRNVLVIDSGEPRNAPAAHMQGFLSRDGMPPADLLEVGRAEATSYGATIVPGSVKELVHCGTTGFQALLADGQRVQAR